MGAGVSIVTSQWSAQDEQADILAAVKATGQPYEVLVYTASKGEPWTERPLNGVSGDDAHRFVTVSIGTVVPRMQDIMTDAIRRVKYAVTVFVDPNYSLDKAWLPLALHALVANASVGVVGGLVYPRNSTIAVASSYGYGFDRNHRPILAGRLAPSTHLLAPGSEIFAVKTHAAREALTLLQISTLVSNRDILRAVKLPDDELPKDAAVVQGDAAVALRALARVVGGALQVLQRSLGVIEVEDITTPKHREAIKYASELMRVGWEFANQQLGDGAKHVADEILWERHSAKHRVARAEAIAQDMAAVLRLRDHVVKRGAADEPEAFVWGLAMGIRFASSGTTVVLPQRAGEQKDTMEPYVASWRQMRPRLRASEFPLWFANVLEQLDAPIPATVWVVDVQRGIPSDVYKRNVRSTATWIRQFALLKGRWLDKHACRALAARYPPAAEIFDQLPHEAMWEHVCRLLAVYFEGGIAVPLHQPEVWSINLNRGVRLTYDLVVAATEQGELCPAVLLAAAPRCRCVRFALNVAIARYGEVIGAPTRYERIRGVLNGSSDAAAFAPCLESASGAAQKILSEVPAVPWWSHERRVVLAEHSSIPRHLILVNDADGARKWTAALGTAWSVYNMLPAACSRLLNRSALYEQAGANTQRVMCAVRALTEYGGVHLQRPLQPRQPFDEWLPRHHKMMLLADLGLVSNFIAGSAESQCLHNAMDRMTSALAADSKAYVDTALRDAGRFCRDAHTIERPADYFYGIPLPDVPEAKARIPRRIVNIFDSKFNLAEDRRSIFTEWAAKEGDTWVQAVSTEVECGQLAAKYGHGELFKQLTLAVSKIDLCRLLELYDYGGVYMDLDVERVESLSAWLPRTAGMVLVSMTSLAEKPQFVNWMFASAPNHPCLKLIIDDTVAHATRALPTQETLHPSDIAGSNVFHEAAMHCLQKYGSDIVVVSMADHEPVRHHEVGTKWKDALTYMPWSVARVRPLLEQHWGQRYSYVPVMSEDYAPRLAASVKHALAFGNQMRLLGDQDCMLYLHTVGTPVLREYWKVLPFDLRGLLCVALESVVKDVNVTFTDARLETASHFAFAVAEIAREPGTAFGVAPTADGVGLSTALLGFHMACAEGLVEKFSEVVSAAVDVRSRRADSTSNPCLDAFFDLPEGRRLLRLSPVDLEALFMSVKSCAAGFRKLSAKQFWDHASLLTLSVEVAERQKSVKSDELTIPLRLVRFTPYDEPPFWMEDAIATTQTSELAFEPTPPIPLAACRKKILDWTEGGFQQMFMYPVQAQELLCALYELYVNGGVYVAGRASRRVPAVLWLDMSASFISSVPNGVKADSTAVSTRFFASRKNNPCLLDALERYVKALTTVDVWLSDPERIHAHVDLVTSVQEVGKYLSTCSQKRITAETLRSVLPLSLPVVAASLHNNIPRQVHLVWKEEALPEAARPIDHTWRLEEPSLERRVVTDDECWALAVRLAGMQRVFSSLPLAVMRADACSLLAVYFHGGIYMDIDVGWVRPLEQWFDFSADLVVGSDGDWPAQVRGNWFFAAKPRHPCLREALDHIVEVAKDGALDRLLATSRDPMPTVTAIRLASLVAKSNCAAGDKVSVIPVRDMLRDAMYHVRASEKWTGAPDFKGWRVEQDERRAQHN
jgi:mannosyltransferase OCH1-like enzyme